MKKKKNNGRKEKIAIITGKLQQEHRADIKIQGSTAERSKPARRGDRYPSDFTACNKKGYAPGTIHAMLGNPYWTLLQKN